MTNEFYTKSVEEVLDTLKTSSHGLSSKEAKKRLEEYGPNKLEKEKDFSVASIFINQFKDFLIILLLIATAISIVLGEFVNAAAIFSIVILAAILGFIQEYKAEQAIEMLKKLSAPTARVLRNNKTVKIPAREIVPGDIVLLESGDIVPADSRLIEVSSLKIEEASLTGESVPSEKFTRLCDEGTSVADQENMAFMNTVVTYGKAKAVITATGMKTEAGKIAKSLQKTKEPLTPLQVKFKYMAKQIGLTVVVLIAIIFFAGLYSGEVSFGMMLLFALSLAVAAIPSSLPTIVTISLALGTKNLAKKNMIIKKLSAAESLGSVTVICADKTGTITKNQMTITRLFTNNKVVRISGTGYKPKGEFHISERITPASFELLLRTGLLCNNAELRKEENNYTVIGDPTEGALITLAGKGGLFKDSVKKEHDFIKELPFDSERKMMSVIYKTQGKNIVYTKGAPDILLKACTYVYENGKVSKLTQRYRDKILAMNSSFANESLRVLALAYRELPTSRDYTISSVEKRLVFLGLVGMIDPPREGIKEAVRQCKLAGIKTIMITGDHATTAKSIAEKIGMYSKGDLVLTGNELEKMSDKELTAKINQVRIIARALPLQKLRIVEALKRKGHVVAMTGDGVNDAPALKKADIGISMGITGTDTAKEVSKAMLVDDNFVTIVNAISEGRNIYDKILKSTRYLLSCNAGEIIAIFISILLRFPLPLIPLQILFMNILTDGLPAIGLGLEHSEKEVMKRSPRDPKKRAISWEMFSLIVLFGVVMGIGTLFIFKIYLSQGLIVARTMAFTTLVMFEMFAVIGSRSFSPFKKLNPLSNKWLSLAVLSSIAIQLMIVYWGPLQAVFKTVTIGGYDWIRILLISSTGFFFMEISKFVLRLGTIGGDGWLKALIPRKIKS